MAAVRAVDAVQSGYNILIVSDRLVDGERVAIPALATSAVHQHLIRAGRTNAGLVVETGSAREVHHFALLAATAPRRSIPTWRWNRWAR